MAEKYKFTQEQYYEAERAAVRQLLDTVSCAKGKPTAIFVAAQPGAGKTGLAKKCMIDFIMGKSQEIVEFDPDVVGLHHPFYDEITKHDEANSFQYLQQFVQPALKTLNAIAIKRKNNILTQGTFRDTEGYLSIFENLKANGYNIEVNLLAVDSLESLMSSSERYFRFLESGINTRVVSTKPHNEAYKRMIETVKEIERRNLADKIRIYQRGEQEFEPKLVYEKGDLRYRSAVEALMAERMKDRKRIISHPNEYSSRLNSLRQNIVNYGVEEYLEQWEYLNGEFEKAVNPRERCE